MKVSIDTNVRSFGKIEISPEENFNFTKESLCTEIKKCLLKK